MSGSSGDVASSAIRLAAAASAGLTTFFAGALGGGMYGMPADTGMLDRESVTGC